ncbi:ATP-binding cassette sub-family B member 8, mitochondrial isoform X2 [Salmo trutta]|uniref:ATP-binding cassette sub-family B member 8, mitochondrial isoform X2 n=1 Tax=Salmo trutta TaxID=8032 RepID=UPI001130FDF6|nr:ATP-binding cassette sub-family B member 8, mitochondrial-like isoform X2 [Salmo trutta]
MCVLVSQTRAKKFILHKFRSRLYTTQLANAGNFSGQPSKAAGHIWGLAQRAVCKSAYRTSRPRGSAEVHPVDWHILWEFVKPQLFALLGAVVLVRALSSGARVFEYLSLEPPFPWTGRGCIPDKSLTGCVDFMNVTFSYPIRPGQQILKNFNLIIPLSVTVAIVGEPGGMSTVASLLECFFDPSSGVIMLDGLDIRTLDPSQRTSN